MIRVWKTEKSSPTLHSPSWSTLPHPKSTGKCLNKVVEVLLESNIRQSQAEIESWGGETLQIPPEGSFHGLLWVFGLPFSLLHALMNRNTPERQKAFHECKFQDKLLFFTFME